MHGANFVHAQRLMRIGRWADAGEKLRLCLADDPDDAAAHALLALCLHHGKDREAALREADLAIRHAPDSAYMHWVRGVVLAGDARHAEAERAAREALRIDPDDADHHHLLAACLMARDQAPAALEVVETGLRVDPEHASLDDLRVSLLTRLGRTAEAEEGIQAALARDPDDPDHHVNVGVARLRAGQAQDAATHFAEALRLAPDNENARVGLVHALKARFFLYRIFLAWIFALTRLPPATRWAVILGGWVVQRVASRLGEIHPSWSPWLTPLVWTYLAFVFLTWTAAPFFSLMLFAHPMGRHALDRRERVAAVVSGVVLLGCVVGVVGYAATGHAIGLLGALLGAMLVAVLHGALEERVARRRRILVAACLAWAAFATVILILVGSEQVLGARLWSWSLYGWIALIFLPGVLVQRGR
ncbi:MAG TPA: tetratricopeptide repeat protein [Planctomycetota bacterium]|nr:tetratricopeptide repeat protein [Planctomycetota bacterium]